MRMIVFLTAAVAISIGTMATAEAPGSIVRLSPAEAEAAKEAASRRNLERAAAPAEGPLAIRDEGPRLLGPIHGEMGFGIGTGGYREIFGAASMPIGDQGGVTFAFDSVQFDRTRRRTRR